MKQTFFFMGCLALLVAGCNKEQNIEEPTPDTPRHLTFDIAVNYGDDTRAVKSEWETNDKIYVFFDFDGNTTKAEYMMMTFNGSNWSHEFSNDTMEAELLERTEGKLYAVYFPYGTPTFSVKQYNAWNQIIIDMGSDINAYLRINYSSSLQNPYTIDNDGKLTAELNMSIGRKDIQFFIPGISEADNYLFSCNQMRGSQPSAIQYNSSTGEYFAGTAVTNPGQEVKGYFYKEGVIFSGELDQNAAGFEMDYEFVLTDAKGTADENDDVIYRLTVPDKTLSYKDAVKLPALNSGRWTIEGANYINGHEFVDMGAAGKWATMNVGANSPEDPGDYFAWGETRPYYSSLDPLVWRNDEDGDKSAGYKWASYRYSSNGTSSSLTKYVLSTYYGTIDNISLLQPEDDAATENWGEGWKTPTNEQCVKLIDGPDYEWTWRDEERDDSGQITQIAGFTVKHKTSGNSIFFPAAGWFDGTTLKSYSEKGYYLTTSYQGSISKSMGLTKTQRFYPDGCSFDRCSGLSVRPVVAEQSGTVDPWVEE